MNAARLIVATVTALTVTHAVAEDHCLTRAEQRVRISEHKLVRLSQAVQETRRGSQHPFVRVTAA